MKRLKIYVKSNFKASPSAVYLERADGKLPGFAINKKSLEDLLDKSLYDELMRNEFSAATEKDLIHVGYLNEDGSYSIGTKEKP